LAANGRRTECAGNSEPRAGSSRRLRQLGEIDVSLEDVVADLLGQTGTIIRHGESHRLPFDRSPDRHPPATVPDGIPDEYVEDLAQQVGVGRHQDVRDRDLEVCPNVLVVDRYDQGLGAEVTPLRVRYQLMGYDGQELPGCPVGHPFQLESHLQPGFPLQEPGTSRSPEQGHHRGGHDQVDRDLDGAGSTEDARHTNAEHDESDQGENQDHRRPVADHDPLEAPS
jgi:hypothetical protein